MRLTIYLMILSMTQIYAVSSFGQKTKLDIILKEASVEEMLRNIESNTTYRFFYRSKDLEGKQTIDLNINDKSVLEILDAVLPQVDLSYEVFDNYIAVREGTNNNLKNQQIVVKGVVRDTESNPLPGVNIVEKGTTNGAVTNLDGEYTISLNSPDAVISFSYIGYLTEEISVNGQTTINFTMIEDIQALDEVVVIGYGTMKKSDITGSVASVKAEDLDQQPVPRIDQALQGRLPGVFVKNRSAEPNARVSIRIRGANSINGGNDPLVVIDGFQGGNLSNINPGDIESVEVLKDASATAIYGSRGANGVILVTTKTGKQGKPVITYDSYFSLHQASKKIDLLNAEQFAITVNEHRTELGLNTVFTNAEIEEFRRTGGTDWQDEIFKNGFSNNHTISITGGDKNLSYYISGGLLDNQGIVLNTSFKRYTLRSNVKAQLNSKLSANVNLFMSRAEDHPVSNDLDSPIVSALIFAPVKDIYDENGNYTLPGGGYGPPDHYNPVALLKESIYDNYSHETSVNAGIVYQVTEDISLNITGGYRLFDSEDNEYVNGKPRGVTGSEVASISNGKSMTLQNTNQISYNKTINDAHNISLTGVFEQQFVQSNSNTAGAIGFLTNSTTYNNLSIGDNPQVPTSTKVNRALLSYMGRVNYSYKSKYLVTFTARADGSSVFGKNNKWGYFPSAALGWNLSEEGFMKNIKSISLIKLRASYGITGNQGVSPYRSLASLNTDAAYPIDGTSLSVGVGLGGIENTDLEWEKTSQYNIGTDIQLFNRRIELIVDYYNKRTKDLLMVVPLPDAAGGYASVLRNVGEVENKGFEIYLGGSPLNTVIKWETGVTFGQNKNRVVALRDDEERYPLGGVGMPGFNNSRWLEVGQPLGLFRGYEQDGVWKNAEASEALAYGTIPGAPKIVDQNNDGIIDSDDIIPTGSTQPDFNYGWNNKFSYKNFDLTVFVQGVYGNELLNLSRVRSEIPSGDSDATSVRILDRWTPENEDTDVPSFTGGQGMKYETSRWVEDASYIRVRDITLGFNLPVSLSEKLKIASARIYVSGTNLFTITDYSGYDPEASNGVDTWGGVDLAPYPAQKMYIVGLNLKF